MKKRCDKLIAKLREKNIDAAIITSPVNRRYFSGFTGSNGVVIVTENGRVLLTDFRYTIQANKQCAGVCEVRQVNRGIGSGDVEEVLKEFDAKRVAYEDAALTVAEFNMFKSLSRIAESLRTLRRQQSFKRLRMLRMQLLQKF